MAGAFGLMLVVTAIDQAEFSCPGCDPGSRASEIRARHVVTAGDGHGAAAHVGGGVRALAHAGDEGVDPVYRSALTVSSGARSGAVTLIQRFGSALNLNLNPYLHMLFLDGAYAFRGKRAVLRRARRDPPAMN